MARERAENKLLAEWFWTDRWMGSSGFLLPMEARGLYREMLTQAWRRGARLPNDHDAIRRATGATTYEWKRAWPLVERFWRVDGDAIVNDTQLAIYTEAQGMAQRASQRGSSGAQARAQALLKQRSSTARAAPEHKPPSPSPSPEEKTERTARAPSFPARAHEAVDSNLNQDDVIAERAGRFCERYAELHAKFRGGAKLVKAPAFRSALGGGTMDFQEAMALCRTWDDDRLDKLAQAFLTTDDEWVASGSRTLARFRSRASWCEERLIEAGIL